MSPADAPLTVEWITRQYGFDRTEVEGWVRDLHFNWPLSVKALDGNGDVIGLLNMSDYRIEEETDQIRRDAPELLERLDALRYTAVFSFIVREDCIHPARIEGLLRLRLHPRAAPAEDAPILAALGRARILPRRRQRVLPAAGVARFCALMRKCRIVSD